MREAKQADIGKLIDDALSLIETDNPKLKGILDKRYARAQLPDGKLGELVDLISSIGFGAAGQYAKDLLVRYMNIFSVNLPVLKVKKAGSFTPLRASYEHWLLF